MMRVLADENCDRLIVDELRKAGHDVLFALESARGADDEDLFRLAHAERRILLTDDLDFGHIAKSEARRPPAIVIARLDGLPRLARIRRALDGLDAIASSCAGQIVIIEPAQIRLRAMQAL